MASLSRTERERMQAEVQIRYARAAALTRTRDGGTERPRPPTPVDVRQAETHERVADALVCILRGGVCLGGHEHDVYVHRDEEDG
jgi:hypothetical protein